jgi:hypothetical protein
MLRCDSDHRQERLKLLIVDFLLEIAISHDYRQGSLDR